MEGADHAKNLLKRLENEYTETRNERLKPNARSYGKVIDAYARVERTDKAGAVFQHMEDNYRNGVTDIPPSVHCYSSVIDAYARVQGTQARERSLNGKRHATGASHGNDLPYLAEEVFQGLLKFYEDYKLPCCRPDVTVFTTMMNVWSKSNHRERIDKVRALLKDMVPYDLKCDVFVYNVLLNALASKSEWESIYEAEEVLGRMEEDDSLRPDRYSYNSVLKAYVRQAAGERAESLLLRWREQFNLGRVDDMPDHHSYSAVINCWANKNNGEKAHEILLWMEKNGLEPNTFVTTALSRHGREAFRRMPLSESKKYGPR